MLMQNADIFATVPKQDYLSLFHNEMPKYQEVVQFLKFKKKDVSNVTRLPLDSVRYDEKMPHDLQERIMEWAILLNLVAEHFHGNAEKTALWFTVSNPLLGNVSPRNMIRIGRFKKLLKYVLNALAQNKK